MKKHDKLHELISCLTMSEKRYFKLFASKNNTSEKQSYVLLFDALSELKDYDEVRLKQILADKGIVTPYLAADKNYLYEVLMKSLRSFHESKSARISIKEDLISVEILFTKGLYRQCLKLLQRARKSAEHFELLPALVEIASWERKIEGHSYDFERITEKFAEINTMLEKLKNLHEYHQLYYKVSYIQRREWKISNESALQKINDLMKVPLLQDENQAITNLAKIRLYEIKARYYFLTNNVAEEYICNQKIWQMAGNDPTFMHEYPMEYIAIYSRYLALCKQIEPEKFEESLKHFRSLPQQIKCYKSEIAAIVFALSYSSELVWLIHKTDFEKAYLLLPNIIDGLEQHNSYLKNDIKINLYYKLSYIYFFNKKYEEALKYVNIVLNDYHEENRPDIYRFARLLNLLIHYELGNFRVLQYEIKNTELFFKSRDKLYAAEKIVLKFIKKLSLADKEEKTAELFAQLCEQLNTVLKDTQERRVLNYFNFIKWAQSKRRP